MGDEPSILVVDNPNLADTVLAILADDYAVLTAYDDEALDSLDDIVEVVLLNRRLPGLFDDDVLWRIEEGDLDCQVTMITAIQVDFDIIEMAFDAYLKKPVSVDDFREMVAGLPTQSTYDEKIQEYFMVASKRVVLRREQEPGNVEESPMFDWIEKRLQTLEQDMDGMAPELTDDDILAVVSE